MPTIVTIKIYLLSDTNMQACNLGTILRKQARGKESLDIIRKMHFKERIVAKYMFAFLVTKSYY